MKKNTLKPSAVGKLTLRRETIQRLTIAQLEDVDGGLSTDGNPRSHYMSCTNTNCGGTIGSWNGC
jgi:hypothetical protein